MSITQGAQDLCLTQSAVSRQVRALEALLGVSLLTRGYRSIAFTAEGERLFRSADGALQQLQDVLGELRVTGMLRPVTVSASIGFTSLWLLPRLARFQALHPNVDVRVSANNRIADLRNEGIDLAIRYTSADQVAQGARRLFGETTAPVAHPSLGIESIRHARDISRLTLIEFDEPRYPWLHWGPWLDAMGLGGARPRAILRFNQYDLVIQAATAGQGVALGRLELTEPLIEEGRLAIVDPQRTQRVSTYGYWLIHSEAQPRREVREVAAWIDSEVEQSRRQAQLQPRARRR